MIRGARHIRSSEKEATSSTRPAPTAQGDGDALKIYASSSDQSGEDSPFNVGEISVTIVERSTIALAYSAYYEHSGGTVGTPNVYEAAAYFIVNDEIYYGGPVGVARYEGNGDDNLNLAISGCITLDAGTHTFDVRNETNTSSEEQFLNLMVMVGANTEGNSLVEGSTPPTFS